MKGKGRGTKFFAMLMTLVLTVGCVGEASYAAEPASKQEKLLETVSDGDLVNVDISDNLLHKGGLLKEYEVEMLDGYGEETLPRYLAVDRDTYDSVETLLKSAYDNFETECSLTQFQLTPEQLKEIVAEVLNTNPRYFYVYGGYSYSYAGDYVGRIFPRYDYAYEQAEAMLEEYDAAVRLAVDGASSDWSDMEKALYINDYLTRNCEYDTTYSNYDAYDVLVTKTAVCQGYALAYLELANQLGLSAEIVTSTSLNHAWNMIEINGNYYQEDATWNDPLDDRLGRARHLYFMKSTEYYQKPGVDHFAEDDWVVSGGLTWTDASSTDYDGYFWNNVDVGFEYIDGYWYGFDGVDRIVKYDCDGNSLREVEELLQIDDVWRVTGSNSFYGPKYLGLGQFNGKLYYSNPYTIYCYSLSTDMTEEIYSLTETEKAEGSIYAMYITPAGEVYYYLAPSLSSSVVGTVCLATVLSKDNPEPEVYTITYELDGGENHSDNPASYTENDSFVFEMPTKANYVFDGWYTDAEYTDPIVGISVGTTGNLVLYAKWVERVYDISFNGNGSTVGQMSDMAGCLFDQSYELSANAYERTGYIFTGWNTRADGSGVSYGDGQTINNLATAHGQIVTLYAQWEAEEYTITYQLDGGTNHNENPTGYTVNDTVAFEIPTKANYLFDGWYRDAEYTVPTVGISAGTIGNLVLYAKWVEKVYDISFDGNGSTRGQMSDMTRCLFGQEYVLSANAYERTGYVFTGWNTRVDGNGVSYTDGQTISNLATVHGEIVTLYAQWEAEEYTITYQLDGGTNHSENPASYTVNDTVVFENPTKANYVFGGWYTDEGRVNSVSGISAGTIGNQTLYAKWITNAYIISFDGNGSTKGQMADMAGCLFEEDYTLSDNSYEREGYIFAGWNTQADGTGVPYADGASVRNLTANNGETVTLYAQWEAEKYTLTYELGGGTNNIANPGNYTIQEVVVLEEPIKENYIFDGWYTDAEYTAPIVGINAGTTGNLVLYAKWVEKVYDISFDGNGSTGGQMSNMTGCLFGQGYALMTNAYERTGYVFAGWNTQADGTGVPYADGQTISNLATVHGEIVTLYAQWEAEEYTITYELNGGANHIANPENYTVNVSVVFVSPTRENYVFDGWYTEAEYTNPIVEISEGTTGNLVLYAKWIAQIYDISFDGNGSTGGPMSDMADCLFGQSYALTANTYERTGYAFAGWNTHADGSGVSYVDGQTISNLATVHGEIVTLYAQWKAEEYTITYQLNRGTNNRANPGTYTVNDTVVLGKPSKINYVFGGWYTDPEYTNPIEEISSGSTGNLVLYAKWNEKVYLIGFLGNGADGGKMRSLTDCKYGTSYTLTKNAYTRTGYTFTGWNTKADGTGTAYRDQESVKNLTTVNGKTIALYAQWKKVSYKITYKLNGGKNNKNNPSSYTVTSATITLKNPTRTGYTFAGWYSDSKYKKKVTKITKGSTEHKTFYAKWTPNKYIIKFDKNGATSGSMSALKNRNYGTQYTLPKNAFKRTGYTFKGWNTKKNGKGTSYKNKEKVKNLTSSNGKTVTLYAQWTPNKYTIKFNGNGATSGKMSSLSNRKYGTTYKLTSNAYKKKGYTFVGWNTKKNGKGKTYKNKASVKNLTSSNGKTITLYAQWKKQKK